MGEGSQRTFHGMLDSRIDVSRLAELKLSLMRELGKKGAGSIVCFLGFVKGRVEGVEVKSLVYEAYEPYATRKLDEIAKSYARDPSIYAVVILHAIRDLSPGEPTVAILVAAESSSKAFSVAREVLERVKREAPIFKLEIREDGEYYVVGSGRRIKRG